MEQVGNNNNDWTLLLQEILESYPEEEREDIRKAVKTNLDEIREALQHITIDLGKQQATELVALFWKNVISKG